MQKINVMHVLHHMKMGGAEHVVYDMVQALDKDKFDVSICCLDTLGILGEELISKGYKVFVLNRKPGVDFSVSTKLAKLYKELNIHIAHAHQYTPYFYASNAALLKRGVKIIFLEHGRHQPDRVRIKRVIYNFFLRPFTHSILTNSEALKEALIKYEKMPAKNIEVIPNGIKLKEFDTIFKIDREKKRSELGLKEYHIVAGMVARLHPIKDHFTLVKAFKKVVQKEPNARLLIAGTGELYSEIARLIDELGLNEYVKLLGYYEDLFGFLRSLDIFVLASISESAPISILEAMTTGLPVVASDVGGVKEMVVDNETGILVPSKDVDALANALLKIIESPDMRERMGKMGRKRVEEFYSFDNMIKKYEKLYISLVGR